MIMVDNKKAEAYAKKCIQSSQDIEKMTDISFSSDCVSDGEECSLGDGIKMGTKVTYGESRSEPILVDSCNDGEEIGTNMKDVADYLDDIGEAKMNANMKKTLGVTLDASDSKAAVKKKYIPFPTPNPVARPAQAISASGPKKSAPAMKPAAKPVAKPMPKPITKPASKPMPRATTKPAAKTVQKLPPPSNSKPWKGREEEW